MKKFNKKTGIIALMLVAAIAVSGVSAYFTDGDTATNTFAIGKVSLDLQEPSWEKPTDVTPNQTIAKDPKIKNDGANTEYVFLEVAVPYQNIVTANADGTKNAAADTELFSYTIDSANWVQVGSETKDTNAKTITRVYAYAKDGAMTPLTKGVTTPALFSSVTFCNAVEDQGLELAEKDIVINAYGIQAENLVGDKTAPSDVWTIVHNQAPVINDQTGEDAKDIKPAV